MVPGLTSVDDDAPRPASADEIVRFDTTGVVPVAKDGDKKDEEEEEGGNGSDEECILECDCFLDPPTPRVTDVTMVDPPVE